MNHQQVRHKATIKINLNETKLSGVWSEIGQMKTLKRMTTYKTPKHIGLGIFKSKLIVSSESSQIQNNPPKGDQQTKLPNKDLKKSLLWYMHNCLINITDQLVSVSSFKRKIDVIMQNDKHNCRRDLNSKEIKYTR